MFLLAQLASLADSITGQKLYNCKPGGMAAYGLVYDLISSEHKPGIECWISITVARYCAVYVGSENVSIGVTGGGRTAPGDTLQGVTPE